MPYAGTELLEVVSLNTVSVRTSKPTNRIILTGYVSPTDMEYVVMDTLTSQAKFFTVSGLPSTPILNSSFASDTRDSDGTVLVVRGQTVVSPKRIHFLVINTDNTTSLIDVPYTTQLGSSITNSIRNVFFLPNHIVIFVNYPPGGVFIHHIGQTGLSSTTPIPNLTGAQPGKKNNTIFAANGTQMYRLDVDTETAINIGTLPSGAYDLGVAHGDWIWWDHSSFTSYVGFNTATGASRKITPAGMPNMEFASKFDIFNNILYRINDDDGTTMSAIDLNTGLWDSKDLSTVRAQRIAACVMNDKIWVPSGVTP